MGKKRVVKKSGGEVDSGLRAKSISNLAKKKVSVGVLHVKSTYNNTSALLTDIKGNAIMNSSSGALGFAGAKKGTPFAAAKVGELLGEKAGLIGVKQIHIIVKGVGAGRESVIRAFASKGIDVASIKDATPIPHNGPRAAKPRRV